MDALGWLALFFGAGLLAGLLVGRWWALVLALLVPVAFIPLGYDSDGAPAWETGLVLYAPVALVGIALGVGARRLGRRSRRRADA